jgi:hypothetical protein
MARPGVGRSACFKGDDAAAAAEQQQRILETFSRAVMSGQQKGRPNSRPFAIAMF